MKTWLDQMQAQREEFAQQQQALRDAKDAEQRRGFSLRFTSMEDRLQTLMRDWPENERTKPRAMAEFVAALKAKYPSRGRGRASPHEIGPALRALGWTRERKWRASEQGFRALWHPPTSP